MKDKDRLSEIRSRLNIDDLDDKARRKLFKEFQNVGGKIVSLDQKAQENFVPSRRSSRHVNQNSDSPSVGNHAIRRAETVNPFNTTVDAVEYMKNRSNKKQKTEKKKNVSFFSFLFSQFNCYFLGIFNLTASKFSAQFIKLILTDIYNECCLLKLSLDPIFKKTTTEALQFRKNVYDKDLLEDYEMAYHTYQLMDLSMFALLQNSLHHSVSKAESNIKDIFASYFLFYQHSARMNVATGTILSLFNTQFPARSYSGFKPKMLSKVFYSVWNLLFIKLEALVAYYWHRYNRSHSYQSMGEYLGIEEKILKIGFLAETWKKQYLLDESALEVEDAENEVRGTYPSERIAAGVAFILENVNFYHYYKKFREGQDSRMLFELNDRVFYAYVLVDFFDSEFSFLWNNNIVNYYVVLDGATFSRFDAKREIQAQHNKVSQFYELVNEYLRIIKSVNSLKKSSGSNAKKLSGGDDKRNHEMSRSSFAARQTLSSIYERYVAILSKIVASKNTADPIVGNLDEIIKTHNEKFMNGHTIEHAIQHALNYTDAVVWLLKHSDLSGLYYELKEPQIFKTAALYQDQQDIQDKDNQDLD